MHFIYTLINLYIKALTFYFFRAASLPTFLKKYTSFHVYVRCMTQGVEILQRLRQYKEAVELLQRLLDQKVGLFYCADNIYKAFTSNFQLIF